MKYIALLRGVNISGKNKIPMKELKEALEKDYNNVLTYLNTGNVIFESDTDSKETIMKNISEIIKNKFALDIPVFVIREEELEDILNNNPTWWRTDNKDIYDNLIFIIPPTRCEDVYNTVGEPSKDIDKIGEYNNVIFWSFDFHGFCHIPWFCCLNELNANHNRYLFPVMIVSRFAALPTRSQTKAPDRA